MASPRITRLKRSELPVESAALARFLIGKVLVHGERAGRIVETEAYLPGDAACHAFRGRTARNDTLFLEHGRAYVYFCYGMHEMMNVSAEEEGVGAGVLLRALQPLYGFPPGAATGPGRLTRAMKIGRALDGLDLVGPKSPIWLGRIDLPAGKIGVSTRIGITKDAHRPLRFYERANPYLSGPKSLNR